MPPGFNDPIGLCQYYIKAAGDWFKSVIGMSKTSPSDEQRLSIGEGIGVFALLTAVSCCCFGGIGYLAYEMFRNSPSQAGINRNKMHDDQGVSLGDLLSAHDIEDKIATLDDKAGSCSPISRTGKLVASNNLM